MQLWELARQSVQVCCSSVFCCTWVSRARGGKERWAWGRREQGPTGVHVDRLRTRRTPGTCQASHHLWPRWYEWPVEGAMFSPCGCTHTLLGFREAKLGGLVGAGETAHPLFLPVPVRWADMIDQWQHMWALRPAPTAWPAWMYFGTGHV